MFYITPISLSDVCNGKALFSISEELVELIKTAYCGANNFGMQEDRKPSTTLNPIEDDLTESTNSTLVMTLL